MTTLESSFTHTLQQALLSLMQAQRYAADLSDLCLFKAQADVRPAPEHIPEIYETMRERMEILCGLLAETNTELSCGLENLDSAGAVSL